ncbi:MAG TPA: hypothetical protein VJN48_12990, partial [Terriglobales bacterium]|nr:hypothetical protein [Terriglobales bacterium]
QIKITVIATGFRYGALETRHPNNMSAASLAISHARIVSSYQAQEHVAVPPPAQVMEPLPPRAVGDSKR